MIKVTQYFTTAKKEKPILDEAEYKKMAYDYLSSDEAPSDFIKRAVHVGYTKRNEELEPMIQQQHNVIQELKEINRKANTRVEELVVQVNDLTESNACLRGDINLMQGAYAEMIKNKNHWERNFYELKDLDDERINVLTGQNQNLSDQLSKQENQIRTLQNLVQEWRNWADENVEKTIELQKKAERVDALERNNEDLGKTLKYREDLNLSLSKKLGAAHKEINRLNTILDKQEYVSEAADALERMINHWQKSSHAF